MEKFRTFAVLFGAERGQKAQEISFASSPRFVRSHAINLHTRKVFLSPNEVKLTKNVTWLRYRRSPGKICRLKGKEFQPGILSPALANSPIALSARENILACEVLASCFSTSPVANVHNPCQKVPKQNFPKMPRAPNSTLGLILD